MNDHFIEDATKDCSRKQMDSNDCPMSDHRWTADKMKVKVNGDVFSVDKSLLAENCEYFRALFQSGMRECRQGEVQLQSVGVQGFLVLIRVLQGDRPLLDGDQIVEAIVCTAYLQVPALTRHMMNIVDSENCVLMYHTAATYGVWELAHHSALFIRDMYVDLKEEVNALPSRMVEHVESLLPSSYVAVCSHSPSSELLQDVQRTVCYLDEERRAWRALTKLPLNASTTMAGVAVLDNKLYIIGGVHDVSKRVVEGGFCYDPVGNTWSTLSGPRQPRYCLTLIGHQGCLYALGGKFNMKDLSSAERLRLSEGSWGFVSALPCQAASVVSAVAMDRIFICLWRGRGATDIHEYVPEADRWHLVTTLVRQQSYGLYMVAHRDNLYVMRNGPCEDFLLCVMDRYNLTTGQWTAVSGQYGNSKGSLFTAVVRGDSVFTLSRHVTTEYTVETTQWKRRREMEGFGRVGSIYTFQMRLPKLTSSLMEDGLDRASEESCRDISILPSWPLQCSNNL